MTMSDYGDDNDDYDNIFNNALVDSERKQNALVFFTSSNKYFAEVSWCARVSDSN